MIRSLKMLNGIQKKVKSDYTSCTDNPFQMGLISNNTFLIKNHGENHVNCNFQKHKISVVLYIFD